MRKGKVPQLLEPGIRLHFLVLFIFSCVTALFNWRAGVIELVITILLILYFRSTSQKRRHNILDYINRVTYDVDIAANDTMVNAPLPMVIFRPKDEEVIWSNELFLQIAGAQDHFFDTKITAAVPAFQTRWLLEGKHTCPEEVRIGARRYTVYGHLVQAEEEGAQNYLAVTYWLDVTQLADVRDAYEASRPVVSVLTMDNYDELTKGISENAKTGMLSEIYHRLGEWTASANGLFCRVDRDRFLFIFEEQYIAGFVENKFPILDSVREVLNPSGLCATLSVGIGRNAGSFQELFQFASISTEMALSRGGDQVVIKSGDTFSFYGGRGKELERRTKVKSRVMANAIGELIADSSRLFVMGHKQPDLDALGAAVGICAIARKKGVPCSIIWESGTTPSDSMKELLLARPEYEKAFLLPQDAFVLLDPRTLLVVVDTNRPEQTISEELLTACSRVAVVDHHRRAASYIADAALNFHEPSASSASELVTELLEYLVEPSDLLRVEAEAILGGIVLDTKQFTIRTGSRTFEAAAYLRRVGADTEGVKKLFRNELSEVTARYSIVQQAKMCRDGIAIAKLDAVTGRVTAAQAADELLNISGIDAAFVLFPDESGQVVVSARSIGVVNVQVILEPLGGGGNAAAAGVQIENTTVDAVMQRVTESIDHYFEAG
ncbi:MAG: DHH family phosphoesterase [Oscillospiraceae bacterium]|nr:DHH family phosphoesterase [Oscillospiraceae bacterium]